MFNCKFEKKTNKKRRNFGDVDDDDDDDDDDEDMVRNRPKIYLPPPDEDEDEEAAAGDEFEPSAPRATGTVPRHGLKREPALLFGSGQFLDKVNEKQSKLFEKKNTQTNKKRNNRKRPTNEPDLAPHSFVLFILVGGSSIDR